MPLQGLAAADHLRLFDYRRVRTSRFGDDGQAVQLHDHWLLKPTFVIYEARGVGSKRRRGVRRILLGLGLGERQGCLGCLRFGAMQAGELALAGFDE